MALAKTGLGQRSRRAAEDPQVLEAALYQMGRRRHLVAHGRGGQHARLLLERAEWKRREKPQPEQQRGAWPRGRRGRGEKLEWRAAHGKAAPGKATDEERFGQGRKETPATSIAKSGRS